MHCKETEDGKTCSKCENKYYPDSENNCVDTNFCLKGNTETFTCEECEEDYYLTKVGNVCVFTENCDKGDKDTGMCESCEPRFCMNAVDGKCVSNQEDDDFKYCLFFNYDRCAKCLHNYHLDEDGLCAKSDFCKKSEFGDCKECVEDYFLDKNNLCTNIEHCEKRPDYNSALCEECEEDYVFIYENKTCIEGTKENGFLHCKQSQMTDSTFCYVCRDGFYLNITDNLCYPNDKKEDDELYKCAKADNNNRCIFCEKGFFLSEKNHKCSDSDYCLVAENGKCQECERYSCLNLAEGICQKNTAISEEGDKACYYCKVTNKKGDKCAECEEGKTLQENGFCVDEDLCEERDKEGTCTKCITIEHSDDFPVYACLNKDIGCVQNYGNRNEFCLKCDNLLNFDICTECKEGYKLIKNPEDETQFVCEPIKEENDEDDDK